MDYGFATNFALGERTSAEEFSELINLYGSDLTSDYLEFIKLHNGGEGDIGKSYVSLWSVRDVIDVTQYHRTEETPYSQFILIGSTGYFHYGIRNQTFFELDLIDDTYGEELGQSFDQFLSTISQRK